MGAVIPEGEAMRRALAWVLAQPERSWETLERAAQRFDLSPLEAATLFRYLSPTTPIEPSDNQ